MVNVIMNEIMDHGPRVGFDDIGQQRPGRSLPWVPVYKTGPRFTKHLTIYRKIILSLLSDRLNSGDVQRAKISIRNIVS